MVYLKTVKGTAKTYYYIAKQYKNKFGQRYERIIAQLEERDLQNIDKLLANTKEQVRTLEMYENIFEAFIAKYGYRQAKHNFTEYLRTFKGLSDAMVDYHWEQCVAFFEKVTGTPFLKKNYVPSRKRGRPTMPRANKTLQVTLKAKHGLFNSINTLLERLPQDSIIDILRLSLDWLIEKIRVCRLMISGDTIRFYDSETTKTIAYIDKLPHKGGIELSTTFRLTTTELRKINQVQEQYSLSSRNQTLVFILMLFSSAMGAWQGFHCRFGTLQKIKKYGKYTQKVRCSNFNQTMNKSVCFKCKRFVGGK